MKKKEVYPWENRYEIIDKIGEGGNGKVFKVKRISDNKIFALKNLKSEYNEKNVDL